MDEIITKYCEEKFFNLLEKNNIDTVCFMGHGYSFEDVKVGAIFYITHSFYCKDSDYQRLLQQGLSLEDSLQKTVDNCISYYNYPVLTDEYRLLTKYKYFINTLFGGKYRREYVSIKNLRTKEITVLSDDWINHFNKFCFVTW